MQKETKDVIKTRVNDAPHHHHLYLLFRRCFSVASSFVNEKSPNHPFCCCLAMIGRKKGGGSFVFFVRKRSQKSKKKSKISPFLGFTFSFVTRATNTDRRKKSNFFSLPNCVSFPRSVRRRGGFRGFRGCTSPR